MGWPRLLVELTEGKPEEVSMESAAAARDDVAMPQDDTQLVRFPLSWNGYEGLVAALGDSHVRLAYDGETLEIMSPGYTHEKIARFIAAILVYALDAWAIDYEEAGATTFRRNPLGGFEGDACFYVANAEAIRGLADIDLSLHPAPDLILEVDISNRRTDKTAIYEACGVTEFWRYDHAAGLVVLAMRDGAYAKVDSSVVVRGLPIQIVQAFIERFKAGERRPAIVLAVQQWLRDNRHLHDSDVEF
jgi:Uma2 family endonuclease